VSPAELWLVLLVLGSTALGTFVGGVAGVGAVLLIAPLVYFGAPAIGAPLDFKAVSNLTTFAVVVSSLRSVGVFRRYGLVRRELFGPMLVPSVVGSIVGAIVAIVVAAAVVQAVFAVASIVSAAIALLPYDRRRDEPDHQLQVRPVALALTGLTVGLVGGLSGAGGGFLLVPMLLGVLHFPTRLAIGTASVNGGAVSLVAFIGRALAMPIDWLSIAAVAVGAFVGAGIGARLQQRVPTAVLRRAVALAVTIAAIRLLMQL
jgi:uncharacterized membrane protein YfcA